MVHLCSFRGFLEKTLAQLWLRPLPPLEPLPNPCEFGEGGQLYPPKFPPQQGKGVCAGKATPGPSAELAIVMSGIFSVLMKPSDSSLQVMFVDAVV